MYNKNNTSLLIQGRTDLECLEKNVQNCCDIPVVISTWEDNNMVDSFKDQLVLKNKIPEDKGIENFILQLISTIEGLKKIKTSHVIKVRGDEFFHYSKLIEHMKNNSDLIFTAPIFFRPFSFIPYHISDHLIAGRTDYLLKMFERAKSMYQMNKKECKEWGLTKSHMRNMGFESFENHDLGKKEMKKLFNIIPMDELKPYKVTVNSIWARHRQASPFFYNNFMPKNFNSIERMEDL
jgi:hypothetical protein